MTWEQPEGARAQINKPCVVRTCKSVRQRSNIRCHKRLKRRAVQEPRPLGQKHAAKAYRVQMYDESPLAGTEQSEQARTRN